MGGGWGGGKDPLDDIAPRRAGAFSAKLHKSTWKGRLGPYVNPVELTYACVCVCVCVVNGVMGWEIYF